MTSIELLICVMLITFSAYMAASEIALFSLSRFQLRSLKENFRPSYRKIKKLLSDPGGLLISVLVVNEVLNIALSSIITGVISRSSIHAPQQLAFIPEWAFHMIIGTLVTAPIILLFCEITPKVIGAKINQVVAPLTASQLIFLYEVFKPIRSILKFVVRIISSSTNKKCEDAPHGGESKEAILKESDFMLMVEEGHKEGAIQESELGLIRNVFELDNTPVAEVATPLAQVLALTSNTTVKGALVAMRSQRYSRIPVISNNRKEVVGILYAKDLLQSKLQPDTLSGTIATLMRKPFFVSPSMQLNTLFRKFKQNKIHMAIVRGANGDILGVVTMSDLLEALFEDLFSEDSQFTPTTGKPQ
jgi:CBS domain containing-hemolysin-like protein